MEKQSLILARLDGIDTKLRPQHRLLHHYRPPRDQGLSNDMQEECSNRCTSNEQSFGQFQHPSQSFVSPSPSRSFLSPSPSRSFLSPSAHHCQTSEGPRDAGDLQTFSGNQPDRPHSQQQPHGPESFPIKFVGNSLSSSVIQKQKLQSPEAVLAKYSKLCCESRVATLSVKLAKDAYFGSEVLAKCTVMGERELPGLPRTELSEMKKILFLQFPNFWQSKQQFEPLWKLCVDAVGQLCKRERSKANLANTCL